LTSSLPGSIAGSDLQGTLLQPKAGQQSL
jgi:hypothetical protein